MWNLSIPCSGIFGIVCCLSFAQQIAAQTNFTRDIRPILSDMCFTCHGPDEQKRVSEFRLDTKEGLLGPVAEGLAVVPGDIQASQLLQRVSSSDRQQQMPPPDFGRTLSPQQIDLLSRWVAEGARWENHWAFNLPQRPALPSVHDFSWCANPVDRFVLAQIESMGLSPSPPANRETLIRRATLDLTGLPPTQQEIDEFLRDSSAEAWSRVVDRLLQSPSYGERLAIDWLDAARYADTSGYQSDGPREMWRWRDWVIDAFNSNMPYDQFTIEQLAGDLLPNPTLSQQIATGFNRNHRGNSEGGIVPEEYQVEYVVDRVDTTCTVWLGLTMGCARCHDHKYDPLTQRDFYRLFAFFNNIPEEGRAIKEGNSPPTILAPTVAMQQEIGEHADRVLAAEKQFAQLGEKLALAQSAWESQALQRTDDSAARAQIEDRWTISHGLLKRFALDGTLAADHEQVDLTKPDTGLAYKSGKFGEALDFNNSPAVALGDIANFGYFDRFSVAAWVYPTAASGTILSRMTPVEQGSGYYVHLDAGRVQINLVKRWLDDAIRVSSRQPLSMHQWQHLVVTYDGTRKAEGIRVYVDGHAIELQIDLDAINQTFATEEPFRLGGGHSAFSGRIDDLQIFDRVLTADEAAMVAVPESITQLLASAVEHRSPAQQDKLAAYYLQQHAPDEIRHAAEELRLARSQQESLLRSIPTVMVMQEMETPRPSYILQRGQYDAPGERVFPGTPVVFPPLRAGARPDRLGLARWLVSADNPLTARVTVNRMWQLLFGTGLVKTPEDFGSQGSLPSHPQLLDYLAVEFQNSGWDLKALLRQIVTSATYQQSSSVSPELLARDPENQYLARGARLRLSAETVRDQALLASGLLVRSVGGPSVRPYQPEGLWKEIASTTEYPQSHGADLYRRSLYTYWKRTVAPPTMVTLDATARESCTVKRSRTNTPLQALALMNEVTFVESARALAKHQLKTQPAGEQRLVATFRQVTGRQPTASEVEVLKRALTRYQAEFRAAPHQAEQLIAVGEFSSGADGDKVELAAWTTVISLLLNLDEVVNKE